MKAPLFIVPGRENSKPAHVVTSEDDPYLDADRADLFARAWGSAFTRLANGGHFNATAGFGPWPLGEALLASL